MIDELLRQARTDAESIIELASALVRQRSRGGIDDYTPALAVAERWLTGRGLPCRTLRGPDGTVVGLVCEIVGGHRGATWVLDACLDTAPFGDESAWSFSPTAGDVADGWLRGRGAADSKTAAAMFCHLAAAMAIRVEELHGTLAVLLDVDEHTGGFGGARAFIADPGPAPVAGAMIGYPGIDEVVVGGRGVFRARLHVFGTAGHSGSSQPLSANAVTRAARLVNALAATELPQPARSGFPLPAQLTLTEIHGGESFTAVPDHCVVGVDVRLTDVLDADGAAKLLEQAVTDLDAVAPAPRSTTIETVTAWPPFLLTGEDQPAAALLAGARAAGIDARRKVAGPSNIGNYLAGLGIPATAGFGLPYRGLHGTDECVHLNVLPAVQAAYHHAVLGLLTLA
jgi:succinyl-diaminopimelate desuccinylase